MKKVVLVILTFLIIITTILFQINVLGQIPLYGICPNIGIVLISAIAICAGPFVGGTVGIFYGLLLDISCGRTVGLNLFLYLFLGVASGYFNNKVSKDNKMSLAIMVLLGTVIFETVYYFYSLSLSQNEISLFYFFKVVFLEEIYNFFLTFVFFRLFMAWGEILNKSRNNYYVLMQ